MATPFPFVSGAVLEAAQLNAITELIINDKTDSYTLVAGDAGERVIMNKATATTITVPNSVFAAGQMVFIANKGAGTSTIVAGGGVTVNVSGSLALAQYGGGTLLALSASTFVFFPAGGVSTLSVDYLLVGGGGGGGGRVGSAPGGGGGGGGFRTATDLIAKGNAYTVTVGASGAGGTDLSSTGRTGKNGTASSFIRSANGGGGGGQSYAQNGGSGGGCGDNNGTAGGAGISGEGNNGGNANAVTANTSGGGGGASAVGSNAASSGTTGSAGGAGTSNDYNGTSQAYSGGGGGGGSTTGGAAGDGSATAGNSGTNAPANRGGGGGGGGAATNGANGGSGRVVLRILTADLAAFTVTTTGSPTTGTNGSYTYYDYTSTGTFRID